MASKETAGMWYIDIYEVKTRIHIKKKNVLKKEVRHVLNTLSSSTQIAAGRFTVRAAVSL